MAIALIPCKISQILPGIKSEIIVKISNETIGKDLIKPIISLRETDFC